jgi:N-acetylneuraminic acid mutarotase
MEEPKATQASGPAGIDLGIPGCERAVEVGRGGFGVVYRAWQPEFDRTVAVKILTTTLEGEARGRFARELRAMGALSGHPHIVTVYHAGFTAVGSPFLVMGFEPGGALADRIRTGGPLPWPEALAIGVKMAGALETAHRAAVLHRDVKPENILLSAFGEPKLADFGIALIQGANASRATALLATIPHAAPELLAGDRPSPASDIYALASTVYTLIRGRPAFAGDGDEGPLPMIVRIGSQAVPDLRPSGVPDAVCEVLERGMAKAPAERVRSAEAFGRELLRADGEGGRFRTNPLVLDVEGQADDAGELVGRAATPVPPNTRLTGVERASAVEEADAQATMLVRDRAPAPTPPGPRNGPTRAVSAPARGFRLPAILASRGRRMAAAALAAAVVVVGLLVLTNSGHGHQPPWTVGASMPTARGYLTTSTGLDGRIYAMGGTSSGKALTRVEVYSPRFDSWAIDNDMPTARWAAASATGQDGRIYTMGGFLNDNVLDTMDVLTPTAGTWRGAAPMPTARRAFSAVTGSDGRIYAIGGFDRDHALATVEAYTPATDTWTAVAPLPTPRGLLAAALGPDGRIYTIGGLTERDVSTVEVYTPATDSWTKGAPLPTPRSGVAAVAAADGRVYAIGGFTGDHALTTVDVYTPSTNTWTAADPMPTARFAAASSGPDGRIYVIGGSADTRYVNTVEVYTPPGNRSDLMVRPAGR